MSNDTIEVDRELLAFLAEQAELTYKEYVNAGRMHTDEEFMDEFEQKLDTADSLIVEAYNA